MSCPTCPLTLPIPTCVTLLNIGYTEYPNEDMYVYVENETTGNKFQKLVTTDDNGLLSIELPYLSKNFGYTLYAIRKNDKCKERVEILIGCGTYGYGGRTVTCIDLVFEDIWDETNTNKIIFDDFTIELE